MEKMQETRNMPESGQPRFFQYGNVRIVISEHFAAEGKTAGSLMEEIILREAGCHREQKAS